MDIRFLNSTLKYLAEPSVADVFKRILKSRLLSYYQLEKDKNEEELRHILNELQAQGLIEKKAGSLFYLDKYFPTREGLEVEKLVK